MSIFTAYPLALTCFDIVKTSQTHLLLYFVCLRITDEDSISVMRILSILLIQSDYMYGYMTCMLLRKHTTGPSFYDNADNWLVA